MPDTLDISDTIKIPLSQLELSYVRSSGPGGQNVNKVSSKAVLRWNVAASGLLETDALRRLAVSFPAHLTKEGEVVITSQRSRDAVKNKADCFAKLKAMILKAVTKPKRRIPTRPTKGSVARRLNDKARQSQKKQNRKIRHDD